MTTNRTTGRGPLLALAAALVGGGLWFARPGPDSAGLAPPAEVRPGAPPAVHLAEVGGEAAGDPGEPSAVALADGGLGGARTPVVEAKFQATLTVEEPLGARTETEGRVYTLLLVLEPGRHPLAVTTTDGVWSGEFPVYTTVHVHRVQAPDADLSFVFDGPLHAGHSLGVVRAQARTHWELRVVDGTSGEEIAGYELWGLPTEETDPMTTWFREREPDPAVLGLQQLAGPHTGPLQVEEARSAGFFLVRAPGYAAQRFQRSRLEPLVEVRLPRAGDLAIRIDRGETASFADLAIEVLGDSFSTVVHVDRWSDSRIVERVPLGAYRVHARYSDGPNVGNWLASATATVVHGGGSEARLDLGAKGSAVQLLVTLPPAAVGAEDWHATLGRLESHGRVTVFREPLESWTPLNTGSVVERRIDSLPLGRYQISIAPTGHRAEFEVADGTALCALDCARSVEVVFHAVAEGRPVRLSKVHWRRALEPSWSYVPSPPQGKSWRTWIPAGPVEIQAIHGERSSEVRTLDLVPGETRKVELELVGGAVSRLRLTLWPGASPVHFDHDSWKAMEVECLDGQGRMLNTRFGGHGMSVAYGPLRSAPQWSSAEITLSARGTYRVRVPRLGVDVEVEVRADRVRRDVLLNP